MIYGIIVILVTIVLTALSLRTIKADVERKKYLIINATLGIIGIILLTASYLTGVHQINIYEYDQELHSWLADYYSLYYDLSVPVFVVLLAINIAASLVWVFDKKSKHPALKVIKETSAVLSSVLLMIFPYYGLFTQNDLVPMYIYMMISGVGMALAIRLSNVITLMSRNNHTERK